MAKRNLPPVVYGGFLRFANRVLVTVVGRDVAAAERGAIEPADSVSTDRPLRADAVRNRQLLLAAAAAAFAARGADVPLEDIARDAGVGIGTLYRHFPTREDLLDAVMKDWVDLIREAADRAVASSQPSRELLLTWFDELVTHICQHAGAAARLIAAMDNPGSPLRGKWQVLIEANARVINRLRAEGALRGGADSADICRLLMGVAAVADHGNLDPPAVRPLLAIVADALLP
jgi:AcrR family transcriptional regulator